MDDYDFENYDPSGYSGLDFGTGSDSTDVYNFAQPGSFDFSQVDPYGFSGLSFDQSSSGSPDLASILAGIPQKAETAFMNKLQKDPISTLASIAGLGTSLYSTLQANKQREAQMKAIQDAKSAREARLAKYGAVMPLKLNRNYNANQGDLLTSGMRPGGMNWFSPESYTPMAEGGAVQPQQGWLDRILSAFSTQKPNTALVGSGAAASAGDAITNHEYQLYLQMQEMNGEKPLPYDVWLQLRKSGKGYAEGGNIQPRQGWLDRVMSAFSSRTPNPSMVGSGVAAAAGDAINRHKYDIYKQGQEMEDGVALPYEEWIKIQQEGTKKARGGALSLIRGQDGGQADTVPIKASHGEYIFDADSVSALGDGNNEAGAAKLDAMRRNLRKHKRSAPPDKIPPKAKSPESYLKGK